MVETVVLTLLVLGVVLVAVWCKVAQDRAEDRAETLLHEHLTPEQLTQLEQTGAVQVASRTFKSRVYTVPIKGFVTVRDDGNLSMRLCVRPERFLPGREAVLAHKLFIEADEEAYVRSATVVWRAVAIGN